MQRVLTAITYIALSANAMAGDPTQQIEEIVVTGAVRSNEAIQITAIDLPGYTELKELPVLSE